MFGRAAFAAVLLVLVVHSANAATPAGKLGRELLQSGVSCPAQIPACTPRRCTTRILGSKETYVCLRCLKSYVAVKGSDGRSIVQCVCPPGTYQFRNGNTRECQPCPWGAYCPGGDKRPTTVTDDAIGGQQMPCGEGLTTKSEKSKSSADCVAKAGYVLPTVRGAGGVRCGGNTYAPEANRLKTCLPCQSGLGVPPGYQLPQANKNEVCQVPPGRFWELNVVRDCPQGLYREEYVRTDERAAIACRSCPAGWTTAATGATSKKECRKIQPGYMMEGAELNDPLALLPQGADIMEAVGCPYGYYNDASAYSCRRCPLDTTTKEQGATSVDDCLVPPGYYVRMTGPNTGVLDKCPLNVNGTGYYRSGWVSPNQAKGTDGTDACTPCGKGILSDYRDFDEIGDNRVVIAHDPFPGRVSSSSASCYIDAGWGMTFDPVDFTKMKGVTCPEKTYGVADKVFGLFNSPCKACTKNTYSPAGSRDYKHCFNPVGFGYTTEGANQCPPDYYTAAESMEPCTPCPPGRYTDYEPGNGIYQASIDDCKVPAGSGVFDGKAQDPWAPENPSSNMTADKCPLGFFSAGDSELGVSTNNPVCERCPVGQSTSAPGSKACDVCAPRFGIPSTKPDSTNPADCEPCEYGYWHAGGALRCSPCPDTPFNHPVGDTYVSYGVTFTTGMSGPETCVPRYAQLPSPAGARLALHDSVFQARNGTTLVGCIKSCPDHQCCIAQWEEEHGTCKHATLPPVGPNSTEARLYYKLPPSELISAASANSTKLWAKTQPAGVYTRCLMDASWIALAEQGLIGTSTNPELVEETNLAGTVEWGECADELACRLKCETNAACWGFVYVPGRGFATRGGEDQLGVRSFLVSPDFSKPSPTLDPDDGELPEPIPPPTCPAGYGNLFDCNQPCMAGTYNDGTFYTCNPCPANQTSTAGASGCSPMLPTKCPAGYGGLPDCQDKCQPGTYNDGSFGTCRKCCAGKESGEGASKCTAIIPKTCKPGRGNAPECDVNCKAFNKYNDGSFGVCMECGEGEKANKQGDGCVDMIYRCPAGKALSDQDEDKCDKKCKRGTFNNGNFTVCLACSDGQTSLEGEDGATSCFYEICPAGYGSVPDCKERCSNGTYNDASFTSCQTCPPGKTSNDGRKCVFTTCAAGMSGDSCDTPCGSGKFQNGSSTICQSCRPGTTPNAARSGCDVIDDGTTDAACTVRPSTSVVSFDCPTGWTKALPGSNRSATAACITTVSSGSCSDAWATLGSGFGPVPALLTLASSQQNGKQVCLCKSPNSGSVTDGYVLKRRPDNTYSCEPDAVFLPTNGIGTDSPDIQPGTVGIWYDLLPNRQCETAQECWDMCFFCDGRPKYHASFDAAKRVATRATRVQQQGSCGSEQSSSNSGNPSQSCQLGTMLEEPGANMFYEACRRWSVEINHFGNQHQNLRNLFNNAAETNSFHTLKGSNDRIWPYRPRRVSTTQRLILYGLQSQASAKCADCFNSQKAEIVDKALVRYS